MLLLFIFGKNEGFIYFVDLDYFSFLIIVFLCPVCPFSLSWVAFIVNLTYWFNELDETLGYHQNLLGDTEAVCGI